MEQDFGLGMRVGKEVGGLSLKILSLQLFTLTIQAAHRLHRILQITRTARFSQRCR